MQDCQVGVLGVGRMGGGIARNYLKARVTTAVYDVSQEAMRAMAQLDAELADSPADLARHTRFLSIVVRGAEDLDAASTGPDGLFAGLQSGSIVVLHSSTPPAATKRFAAQLEERGVRILEAAMTGGVAGAASGNLTVMCAGDPGLLEECWPTLRIVARRRLYLGPLGSAGVVKAIQDLLFGIYHHTTNELLQVAVASGVDPDRFFDVMIAKGSVAERWTELWDRDGSELIGTRSPANPRSALTGFDTWLWDIADELGMDVSTSRDTVARSIALQLEQLRGQ